MKLHRYNSFINESVEDRHLDIDDVKNFFADFMDEFPLGFEVKQDEFSMQSFRLDGIPGYFKIESQLADYILVNDILNSHISKDMLRVIKSRLMDYAPILDGHEFEWILSCGARSEYVSRIRGERVDVPEIKARIVISCKLQYKKI